MTEYNPREMQKDLAKPFAPEDLEWRLQTVVEDKMRGLAVPYVTNRAIQNRLDDVCGPENWYNEYKPWHPNGKKESQLCGIAIYFEGRGWITKWDGAEDSDIEPVKGGLSDSMKRAAYQWGIGRVLYSLDTVWVDIERRGRSYAIKDSERTKLDNAYLSALKRLGLIPADAGGLQSLLTPKSAPEPKTPKTGRSVSQAEQYNGFQQSSAAGQRGGSKQIQHRTQPAPQQPKNDVLFSEKPTSEKTMPFGTQSEPASNEQVLYVVRNAKIQGGISGSNTLVMLEAPNNKQVYAYVRGSHPELKPGTLLANVKLTTRKQDTVVFYILESYDVIHQAGKAA